MSEKEVLKEGSEADQSADQQASGLMPQASPTALLKAGQAPPLPFAAQISVTPLYSFAPANVRMTLLGE